MVIRDYFQNHKKLVLLGTIVLAVLVTVGMVMRARTSGPQYMTAVVQRGELTAAVQATGTINPLTTVPVGSYVSGTVQYIFADFNSRVRAGQVLAQLDPAIYEAQVLQARGNLARAQADIKNLEANLAGMQAVIQSNEANLARPKAADAYAGVNARRVADLYKQGILAEDQYDLTQANMEQSAAQVRAAEAQVDQSRAQLAQTRAQLDQARAQVEVMTGALRQAETNLRYTTIVSPIDGTVVARNVTVGQSVAASLQAPNVFTIAQDLKRMQVYAKTDESDTGDIKVGTDVTFQVDSFPSEVFHGRVSTIRLNATIVQNVVTYDTVIDFENPEEKLLPGQTAYVTIPTGHAGDTVKIPNAALRFKPELAHDKMRALFEKYNIPISATGSGRSRGWQVVWKQLPGSGLQPVAVKIGITDYSFSQLLEGKLQKDDALVTGQAFTSSAGQQGSPLQPQRMRRGG